MALNTNFPESPYAILDPAIRWFPADEALRESSSKKLMPPLVPQLRRKVGEWRDSGYLRELITGERLPCIVRSGYRGERGEVWLARVLPPPGPSFTASLVMTTPYVLVHLGEPQWQTYLDRTLPKLGAADRRNAY